ncbi:maleylpyruvate isomerase family mycothiol-dependent enzyme [soil metagenome]
MTLSTFGCIAAITQHSAGFADAARGNLEARVEHCPEWSVADMVVHLTDVHWFWATIVEGRLDAPPAQELRPPRAADEDLVDTFVSGAARLVEVLREADQSDFCWTWAGWKQDVEFVTRHQVQEAAVHHWDAVHAAGDALVLDPSVSVDAVGEFLAFSVASEDDPDDPPETVLDGEFTLRATDTGDSWAVSDGSRPGTAHIAAGTTAGPVVEAPAADLLLWLYGRVDLGASALPNGLLARFRGICFTD